MGSNMRSGLTLIGFVAAELTAAPESSRRAAASSTQLVGGSTAGAVGEVPASGFKIRLTIVARAVKTLRTGVAAVGVAGCVVTIRLGVRRELCAVDTDDSVEVVVAACVTATLEVGSEVAVDRVFATTLLVAPVALFVPAGEESGELGATWVGLDDDRSLLRCCVAATPVVLPVLCVESSVLASDDV
jgi:hypothetical protein